MILGGAEPPGGDPFQCQIGIEPDVFTFTASSAYASPDPSGTSTNDAGTTITNVLNGIEDIVVDGSTNLACVIGTTGITFTGWALTGTPDTNSAFSGITTNVIVTPTNATELVWNWGETNFYVTTSSDENGSIDLSSGWYRLGTNLEVTATPNQFYHFSGWSGDGTNYIVSGDVNSSNITVDVASPFTLTGNFDFSSDGTIFICR